MIRKQRGVTMIGWICLLIPIAITVYAGIRVAPEYMNYYKVVKAMEDTASQLKSDETLSPDTIRKSLDARFDTGYVVTPAVTDIKIAKGDKGWSMGADYEAVVPLFGNMHLLMAFKKTVDID